MLPLSFILNLCYNTALHVGHNYDRFIKYQMHFAFLPALSVYASILNCLSASCNTLTQQGDDLTDSASSGDGVVSELTETLRHSIVSYEEHLNDVAINMQNFQSSIAAKVWEIDGSTPEDGNCFFWAVSSQLDSWELIL